MITIKEFLMGRDEEYPLNLVLMENAADLLSRVNYLLGSLNLSARVSSGYRPGHFNTRVGGAQKSAHVVCRAVDLRDPKGELGRLLVKNKPLLEEVGLWLENPEKTPTWVHLDTKQRKNRIFNP